MDTYIEIPDAPRQLMNILTDAGCSAYVVGGCVRDSLLGRTPHDWDICTSALPGQMKSIFRNFRVIETGLKHGTLTVLLDGVGYEITTFRKDGVYSDHRHPDSVEFVSDLKEDLSRRDFRINAMAADSSGRVIDYSKSRFDLKLGQICCVGNPDKRFQEDALRILRAIRFASRFGFFVEKRTEEAMFRHKDLLKQIAPERMIGELSEILLSDACYTMLRCYQEIFAVIIPEITPAVGFLQHNPHHYMDVWNHTVTAVSYAPKDLYVRLALLYHDLGKPHCMTLDEQGNGHFYHHSVISAGIAENSLKNLRFDNKTVETVTQLVEFHDHEIAPTKASVRRCLNRYGAEQFERLLHVKAADKAAQTPIADDRANLSKIWEIYAEIQAEQDCYTLKDLAVSGKDLMELGFRQGIQLGAVLKKLLDAVVEGTLENKRSVLMEQAKTYLEV
jgi:tRNA nucleotidyltransferase (CCA-adding enzyme)